MSNLTSNRDLTVALSALAYRLTPFNVNLDGYDLCRKRPALVPKTYCHKYSRDEKCVLQKRCEAERCPCLFILL